MPGTVNWGGCGEKEEETRKAGREGGYGCHLRVNWYIFSIRKM